MRVTISRFPRQTPVLCQMDVISAEDKARPTGDAAATSGDVVYSDSTPDLASTLSTCQ